MMEDRETPGGKSRENSSWRQGWIFCKEDLLYPSLPRSCYIYNPLGICSYTGFTSFSCF